MWGYSIDEMVSCEQEPLTLWQNFRTICEGVSFLVVVTRSFGKINTPLQVFFLTVFNKTDDLESLNDSYFTSRSEKITVGFCRKISAKYCTRLPFALHGILRV